MSGAGPGGAPPGGADPGADGVGLCARCAHARVQRSRRGSRFWRCGLAEHDARFLRYPPLPVRSCPGYRPAGPGEGPGEPAAGPTDAGEC